MKRKLTTIFNLLCIAVLVAACATNTKQSKQSELRSVLDDYIAVSKSGTVEDRSKYYTPELWEAWKPEDGSQNDGIADIANRNVIASREKIEDSRGCLVIEAKNQKTGYDEDYQLDFVRENNRWLFADFGLTVYNDSKRPTTEYYCEELRQAREQYEKDIKSMAP